MKELAKAYSHEQVEVGKEDFWEQNHYFEAMREENLSKTPFSMIVPPPNVTGILHIGHATNTTIMDIIARYKKLSGYDVLFLADMDHAGIATQAKVEEKLRSEGKDKYEMGREAFLKEAWKWKEDHASYITKQWRALGLSMDYTKERFTLDEGMQDAVAKVFKTLYDEGYIYRGERIINWDPVLKTALSDIEVTYSEDPGEFYYFKYWLEDHSRYLEVATTRPETMFGDTACCFNPDDERYKALEGKKVINPANGELLPLIPDRYVDIEFGTGAMKCTPAHDPNDYKIALRHNLPIIKIMNDDATMNEKCGDYNGLDRYECRKRVVEKIKEDGNLIKIEHITHNVGHSERSNSVVEPMLSKQWFVKMKPLADAVLNLQNTDEKIEFFPKRFENIFAGWLSNTQDWCISRQLWWGHRIPVYTNKKTGEVICSETPLNPDEYEQDPDVLDTWFSSALAPFGFLGWPDVDDPIYKRYYPLDLMVTAYDIIFFWVERMAFQGVHFTKEAPFKKVYIHGLVRDAQGRKMSKSLGNGIDPFDVIKQYGTDSLRFALATGGTPGMDLNFSLSKVEKAHNFLNKVWNAARYILLSLPDGFTFKKPDEKELSIFDHWIYRQYEKTAKSVFENMEKYELGQAADYLYNFIYDDFCSNYIEFSKIALKSENEEEKEVTSNVLYDVLKKVIVLLFPFAPFISEELYQHLPGALKSVYEENYPKNFNLDLKDEKALLVDSYIDAIKTIRNFKSENSLAPNASLDLYFIGEKTDYELLKNYLERFSFSELRYSNGHLKDEVSFKRFSLLIKADEKKMAELINKRVAYLKNEIERCEKLLNNPSFVSHAKPEIVAKEKEKHESFLQELKKYQA